MDLAIEANRNSALFNTMQQVLDVYNPLLHKARPTIVNQTKTRIRAPAAQWGNTFDRWNGRRSARFNIPRIGSLADVALKVAFAIPGVPPNAEQRLFTGDRGFAKASLTTGGLDNTGADETAFNTARGRLDRVYSDRLLGLNMVRSYVVSSKSREIFRATGEYLLTRFSQMDETMKKAVFNASTPVDVMNPGCDDMFLAPGLTYQVQIPLFAFFNEHITNALDVNFSEEVHIDVEFRSPSELFYYGNIGDLSQMPDAFRVSETYKNQKPTSSSVPGFTCWDQSTIAGSTFIEATTSTISDATVAGVNSSGTVNAVAGTTTFGSANVGVNSDNTDIPALHTFNTNTAPSNYSHLVHLQQQHIQGISSPSVGVTLRVATGDGYVTADTIYGEASYVNSATTFGFPDVDNNGDSVSIQLEMNCDFIIQDTDAYRALRAETFPQGTGFTSVVFNTSQETFSDMMAHTNNSQNLLDARSGGSFSDPDQSSSGISIGDSTRFVDLPLRDNHLAMATHFMVRKMSDMGGSGQLQASKDKSLYNLDDATGKNIGRHQIYSRLLPVHYFQIMAAGRIIYESDGASHQALTQSAMYNGTGADFGTKGSNAAFPLGRPDTGNSYDVDNVNARPFNVYSINHGLQASRLENTGCLSYQNLNNPMLRIYFKPDTWSEHSVVPDPESGVSPAQTAAAMGVQIDVIHEHFNVITVNSGNGEITSGLNQ